MAHGIFDLVGLLGVLIFALPVALFGLQRLAAGEALMGVALLVIAVGMVAVEQYFMSPGDIPKELARDVVEERVDPSDDEE
jgi:hypothetical protein